VFISVLLAFGFALTPAPPCAGASASSFWCDHTQGMDERVNALVENLTDSEKAGLFLNGANAVDRLDIPSYNWWSEALHGVARDGVATSFPQIIGVSSSFNNTLFNLLGNLTGTEARGKNNALDGDQYHGLTMWAPNINIFRDPRWGRGQETPGEDPTLNSHYAKEYVSGLQGDETKNGFLRTSACLKHYAAYSEETGRTSFGAVVNSQDMQDTYLPAFEYGVKEGKASGLMCSYNSETYGTGIYGPNTWESGQHGSIPSCANKGILEDLVRKQWGFDGYITSDCGAVKDVESPHHYTNTTDETVRAVLSAGMDTDCGSFMSSSVMKTLLKNQADEFRPMIDKALTRLFKVQFRLGFFDPRENVPFSQWGSEVVDTPEHRALAKEAADQSIVLLKNNQNTASGGLPLKASSKPKLAVLGRNAAATSNMQGNYFGTAPFLISPVDGFSSYTTTTTSDGSDVDAAVKLALEADVAVLVVGLTSEGVKPSDEAEGHDRTSLILPNNQNELISSVGAAMTKAGKPTVLIIMGGGPVDVAQFRDSSDIDAIMWVGYPGQSGGQAIADAVFGQTNPAGKLTQTWYPESFTSEVALTDMGMRPNATSGNPGRTYRFYTGGDEVFKFGEGMSYTSFASHLSLSLPNRAVDSHQSILQSVRKALIPAGTKTDIAVARATITNTGNRTSDHIILLFGAAPIGVAGVNGVPLRSLRHYARVSSVAPGENVSVEFTLNTDDFVYPDHKTGAFTTAPGTWRFWLEYDGETAAHTLNVV